MGHISLRLYLSPELQISILTAKACGVCCQWGLVLVKIHNLITTEGSGFSLSPIWLTATGPFKRSFAVGVGGRVPLSIAGFYNANLLSEKWIRSYKSPRRHLKLCQCPEDVLFFLPILVKQSLGMLCMYAVIYVYVDR